MSHRREQDTMGVVMVPASAYYGANTQRAVENFPISGMRFPRSFIRALGVIKKYSAQVNADLGLLDASVAEAVATAAEEVVEGKLDDQFVLDVFQTGSGTSTNMNANEVIAGRANEILTGVRGGKSPIHPNDHVNLGQSSNDVIPTALHVAALTGVNHHLLPAMKLLEKALGAKALELAGVRKIGRTHLQDAVPINLGDEFSGYARQVALGRTRISATEATLSELALGGTAVGNGLSAHPEFAPKVISLLAQETGCPFREAVNHFEAQAAQDAAVELSGALKTFSVSLFKIANDIRWLASGPRCGLGEINIPSLQPGSSIMPGKVNPVIPEVVIQVAGQVIGHDAAITFGGCGGIFELNVMLPLIAHNLLRSIDLLTAAAEVFANRCVDGISPNIGRCLSNIEQSLAVTTALVPALGYDKAASLAKEAFEKGKTIRELAREKGLFSEDELRRLLDPMVYGGD